MCFTSYTRMDLDHIGMGGSRGSSLVRIHAHLWIASSKMVVRSATATISWNVRVIDHSISDHLTLGPNFQAPQVGSEPLLKVGFVCVFFGESKARIFLMDRCCCWRMCSNFIPVSLTKPPQRSAVRPTTPQLRMLRAHRGTPVFPFASLRRCGQFNIPTAPVCRSSAPRS